MTTPAKLGVLIPEFPGQTHSFFWREIEALAQDHGIESQIISTRLPQKPVYHDWVAGVRALYLYPVRLFDLLRLLPAVLTRGVRLFGDAESRRLLRQPKNWAFALLALRLGQVCRQQGIGHLHVHSCANFALIAAFCHKTFGVPYSLVLHGPLGDYGSEQPYKWAGAQFVFVITEMLRAEVLTGMPQMADKISVVPMGVNTDVFAPPDTPRPLAPDPFIWFCCARLNRVKGFDTLLEAARLLSQTHPDHPFRIVIAGEDEQGGAGYHTVLANDIARTGLSGIVTLLGSIPQDEVRAHLGECHGFVLASRHEPLGVAYMEAMACELPVVGTSAGGVTELIETGQDGLLVAAGDAAQLAQAMGDIMSAPELRVRLGQQARRKIVQNFSSARSALHLAERLGGARKDPDT
jgi:colanic acid/amylovoran biosynthesis glycosyltransferase